MSSPRDDQNPEGLDPATKLSGLSPQQNQESHEADRSDDEQDPPPVTVILKNKR
jgi:hypothetical protein